MEDLVHRIKKFAKLFLTWEKIQVLLVFLAAFIIRIFTINRESLHIDEFAQANTYYLNFWSMINSSFEWGRHPPLDFIIGWIAVKIFPYSDALVRMPSLIFGSVSASLIFLLSKRYCSLFGAFSAAIFVTIWFPSIFYSQYVRPYTIFVALFSAALLLLSRNINGREPSLLFTTVLILLPWSRGADGVLASILILLVYLVKNTNRIRHIPNVSKISLVLLSNALVFIKMNSTNHDVIFASTNGILKKILTIPSIWFSLISYENLLLGIFFLATLLLVFVKKSVDGEFKLIILIALLHSLISVGFVSVFSNQGIYPRYQVIQIVLIALVIAAIYPFSITRKKLNKVLVFGTFVVGISIIVNTSSNMNKVQNFEFRQLNLVDNESKVAMILGTSSQYLPGWPQIVSQEKTAPVWISQYAISDSYAISGLIVLAEPDVGFLPIRDSIHELGLAQTKDSKVSETFIEYLDVNSGFAELSMNEVMRENIWFWLSKIKWESGQNASFQVSKSIGYFCEKQWLSSQVDLGNSFGFWGQQEVLSNFLAKNGIFIDCANKTYSRGQLK